MTESVGGRPWWRGGTGDRAWGPGVADLFFTQEAVAVATPRAHAAVRGSATTLVAMPQGTGAALQAGKGDLNGAKRDA